MGDCFLVVTMVRVFLFIFNRIITDYFCTPQKASIGMYSRCGYIYSCLCTFYPAIPISESHSSINFLFNILVSALFYCT